MEALWWSVFLVTCVFIGVIGLWNKEKTYARTAYYYGTRVRGSLNAAVVTASTNFSAVTAVVLLLDWSYQYGWSTFGTLATGLAGILLWGSKKTCPINDDFAQTGLTLHEFIGGAFVRGRAIRRIAGLISIAGLFGFHVVATAAIGTLLGNTYGLPEWLVIGMVSLTIGVYVGLGGYDGVRRTDWVQIIMISGGVAALLVLCFQVYSETHLTHTHPKVAFDTPDPGMWITLIIVNGFYQIGAADMWQRSLATRNSASIRRGAFIGTVLFAVLCIGIIFLGIQIRLFEAISGVPGGGPERFMHQIVSSHAPLGVIILVFLVASYMSTSDQLMLICAETIGIDIVEAKDIIKTKSKIDQLTTITLTLLGGLLAYLLSKLSSWATIENILYTCFSCQVMLVPFVWLRNNATGKIPDRIGITSLLIGIMGITACSIFFYDSPTLSIRVPTIVFTVTTISLFLFRRLESIG